MPKRGNLALAACETCRQRKVRCDGVRPVCGACKHRDSTCTFQSLPGLTRTAALKSEVSQLRTDSSNLLGLYRQLRDGSAIDAWNLVEQIRSGEVPIDMPSRVDDTRGSIRKSSSRPSRLVDALDTVTLRPSRRLSQPAMASSPQTSHVAKRYAVSQRPFTKVTARETTTDAQSTNPEQWTHDSEALTHPSVGKPKSSIPIYGKDDADALLQLSLQANLVAIQKGFRVQQSCIAEIFSCHSKEAFEKLISCLKQDNFDPLGSSILCEICAVAVVAGQYVRDSLEPGVLDRWYDYSCQHFRECVSISPANAIKVAAMLGLYNLLQESRVAIDFFETGLSLSAQYLEEYARQDGPTVDPEVLSTLRTRRSLVFCHGWLQATLGDDSTTNVVSFLSDSMKAEEVMIIQTTEPPYSSEHDMVHGVATTIAALKATAMRMLWACSDVPGLLYAIHGLQGRLNDWYEHLPEAAQLIRLGDDGQTPLKSSIYYVHLLHLGAVMLMFRHCLAGLQFSEDRETLSSEQRSTMHAALNDGLQAAQQSARMTYLTQRFSPSVRHCWTMIYQAYVSGMILIYHAAQLRLAGYAEKYCAVSCDLASKVVDRMKVCKELDPVARKLTVNLAEHYESLRDAGPSATDAEGLNDVSPPQSGDYLFNASPESAVLHETSRELFERLCNPYADREALAGQHERPSAWLPRSSRMFPWRSRRWEGDMGSGYGEAPAAITPEISNLEDGYFLGSRDPSWWLAKRASASYAYENRMLEVS